MRLKFMLNDEKKEIEVNSNEPLSFTLRSFKEDAVEYPSCKKYDCGHCVVENRKMDEIILSCLTPVYKVQGSDIITPDYFYTSKKSLYIRSTFKELAIYPCEECKKERVLVFNQIVNSILKKSAKPKMQKDSFFFIHNENEFDIDVNSPSMLVLQNKDFILSYMSIIKCSCMRSSDILKVVEIALEKKEKSNV